MDDVVVVISCPLQASAVERLLASTVRIVEHFRIPATLYLLDDRVRDDMAQIAARTRAVYLVQPSRGYGSVINAVLASTTEKYIVTLDGDGAHPPELLPYLYAMRDRAEIVIASRYVRQGFARMPLWRQLLSRVLNRTFRVMLDLPFRDLSSSYRLYPRSLLASVAPVMGTDAALQEILIKSFCEGYSIAEVPMHYIANGAGRSRRFVQLLGLGFDYVSTLRAMWKLRNSIDSCDYDTRAFFSRIPFQRWWQRRRYAIVSGSVARALRVLDAGCGSTQLLNRLPHVVGMDVSLRKLRFMRQPGRRLVNGSTFDLPFRSGAFDVVISSQVVEHLADEIGIFRELIRCLAPEGTLILGTVDYGRWQWPFIERLYGMFKPSGYAQEHITHYTAHSLVERLKGLRMNIESVQYICGGEIVITAKKPACR